MIKVYGTASCGSVRKCLAFFRTRGVDVEFIDFKSSPPSSEFIRTLVLECGSKRILNKSSATWRTLADDEKALASTNSGIIKLLSAKPLLIKRPVVLSDGNVSVGINEEFWLELVSKQ